MLSPGAQTPADSDSVTPAPNMGSFVTPSPGGAAGTTGPPPPPAAVKGGARGAAARSAAAAAAMPSAASAPGDKGAALLAPVAVFAVACGCSSSPLSVCFAFNRPHSDAERKPTTQVRGRGQAAEGSWLARPVRAAASFGSSSVPSNCLLRRCQAACFPTLLRSRCVEACACRGCPPPPSRCRRWATAVLACSSWGHRVLTRPPRHPAPRMGVRR
jgi:hypothetical protein